MSVLDILATPAGAWARDHLENDIVGWITTQAPDGRLQATVISFLWDGASILFYSRPDTPKIRNIETHPQIAFNLNTDAYGDRLVTIEGIARIDPSIPSSIDHETYRAKYRAPLEHWGMDEAETAADFSVPIVIRPTRIRLT